MNPLTRMFLSLTATLAVYAFYWWAMSRRHRVRMTFWSRSVNELRLRSGMIGFGRLFTGWTLAFVTYAFLIETSGEVFTWQWLQECLLKGDWIGVLIIATLLTLCERHLAMKRIARIEAHHLEDTPKPASS